METIKEQLDNILSEDLLSREEIINDKINKLENKQYKIQKIINEKNDISMKIDTEIGELSKINEKLMKILKSSNKEDKEEFFKIENLTKNIFKITNKRLFKKYGKMVYLGDEISDLENEISDLENEISDLKKSN